MPKTVTINTANKTIIVLDHDIAMTKYALVDGTVVQLKDEISLIEQYREALFRRLQSVRLDQVAITKPTKQVKPRRKGA